MIKIKGDKKSEAKGKGEKKAEQKDGVIVLRADRLNEDKWERTKRIEFLDIEKIQNA